MGAGKFLPKQAHGDAGNEHESLGPRDIPEGLVGDHGDRTAEVVDRDYEQQQPAERVECMITIHGGRRCSVAPCAAKPVT